MDQSSEVAESSPRQPSESENSSWQFVVYIILILFFVDFLGFALVRVDRTEFLFFGLVSAVFGQVALAILVGGLMGDNWLEGVLLSTITAICGVGLFLVANGVLINYDGLLYMSTIPLFCLAGALPLILLRWTIGWRLTLQSAVAPTRARVTIEDMVLLPASLVAFCVMALVPINFGREDSFAMESLIAFLLPLAFCLLFVLPCIYWAFRIEDGFFRWMVCLGYPLVIAVVAILCITAGSPIVPGEAYGWSIFGTLFSSSVAMLGFELLFSNGYRLTRYATTIVPVVPEASMISPAQVSEPSPFDIEPTPLLLKSPADALSAKSRRRYRIEVGILLATTAIVNSGIWAYTQIQLSRSLARIVASGGTVEMMNGKPIKIFFGPSTTEVDIQQLPRMPSVKSISLAGTKARTFYSGNNFKSLETVDIRKTQLQPGDIGVRSSIDVLVSQGQFTNSDLDDFKKSGMSIKQVAD